MSIAWIWSGRTAEFKNDAEYVAAKSFLCGDKELQPGDLIDKTAVSVRRLRQLHDQRYVALKTRWETYWAEKPQNDVVEGVELQEQEQEPIVAIETIAVESPSALDDVMTEQNLSEIVTTPMEESAAPETLTTAPVETPVEQPVKATARYEGKGKWAVMIGDVKVADGLSKSDAVAQADELNK